MRFELIIEIEPSRNPAKVAERARRILELPCAAKAAVPDAPLGAPKALGLAIASYLEKLGLPSIAHVRLRDMNKLLFEQLVWSTLYLGVRRLLFLRGDPPRVGVDVDEVDSVTAAKYVKSKEKLRYLQVGLYMSLRHPPHKVLERARSAQADFYVLNHFDPHSPQHREILAELKNMGARIYAYLILAPSNNLEEMRKMLGGYQAVRSLENLGEHLDLFRRANLDGVVLSAPGYLHILIDTLNKICGDEEELARR